MPRERRQQTAPHLLATTKGVAIMGYVCTGIVVLGGVCLRLTWISLGEDAAFGIDDEVFPSVTSTGVPLVAGSFFAFRNGLFGRRSPLLEKLLGAYLLLIPGYLIAVGVLIALSCMHEASASDLLVLFGGAAWAACVSFVATLLFEEDGRAREREVLAGAGDNAGNERVEDGSATRAERKRRSPTATAIGGERRASAEYATRDESED